MTLACGDSTFSSELVNLFGFFEGKFKKIEAKLAKTTSNARVMADLSRPIFSLPWTQYLLVWGLVGLVGLGVGVGIIYPVAKSRK